MAKLLDFHPELGKLAAGLRPHTSPSAMRHSSSGRQTVILHPGRRLTLEQVQPLIHSRLPAIKSAFTAVDPGGTGLVSREEFRRVLENLLSLSQKQLDSVVKEVCEASGETVDYMQFLRSFRRAPAAHRACSSVRRGPRNTSMSLSEIQKHLREKIGGNLRTVIRVFRLFDCNREGRVQQHELRRILDNYCIHLTDKEFQRLWNHYSPKNTSTISYELFLDQLGFGDSRNFNIAPVCTKLEVSGRGTTPPEKVKQRTQRPESVPGSSDASSVMPHGKLQTLFYDKMCMNSTPVWRALQAFDTTCSGLVKQDVLRAVLSSFIFPMTPHSFHKLTSRYGVRATGPVSWKHFLGHFMSPSREEEEGAPDPQTSSRTPERNTDEDLLDLQDFYPRLKQIFHLLDERDSGWITRADLRYSLERPGGTQPRLRRSQVTELVNALDPEHTGVIQLAGLERLNPGITCAPSDSVTSPTSPAEDKADERQTTQRAGKESVASASWETVETLLLDTSCEQLRPAFDALKLRDPHNTGLCETSSSTPGSSSELVSYARLLRHLGAPPTPTSPPNEERLCTPPQAPPQPLRGQRPLSSSQPSPNTYNLLDVVFQRMRLRLEQRQTSLAERVQSVSRSADGLLSETDVWKILEDSWVILDDEHFNKFTELLGFRDGRIERSLFLSTYEEVTARDQQQGSEGHPGEDAVRSPLTSAEESPAARRTRTSRGGSTMALSGTDMKREGVVGRQTTSVQEQLHELLASEARYKWADMSKVLCQFDSDGRGWIHKKSLRDLLYTYALPMTPEEFDQLWSRYDPERQDCVPVCDFLEKLGFHHEGELGPRSQKLNPADAQQDADRAVSSDAATLDCIQQTLQDFTGLSDSLTHLERRDGSVTVEQLLSLLQTYSCSIQREQLVHHLRRLKVSMDKSCSRLSYMDFLSALDHKAEKKYEPPPASPDAVHQIQSLHGLSPDVALAKMQELVAASSSHLYKTFVAFDQSGTGTVKALQFRRVLEKFCARLSDRQYRYLLTRLELDCENGAVNWKDFLEKFKWQSSPTRTPEVEDQLHQTQEVVSGHLCEEQMDVDSSNSATISKEQFRRLCDRHCPRLTNDQFECVWSHMPINGNKKLQYREFLKRFGAQGRTPKPQTGGPTNTPPMPSPEPGETETSSLRCTKSAPQCSSRRAASAGRPETGSPLGSMERKLRGSLQRCWKEIQKSCAEVDHQQEGQISLNSFLEILQSLHIRVTPEQFERLVLKSDIMKNGRVSYHNFLRHFLLNLKPAESMRAFERRKLPLPTTTMNHGVLSRGCVEVMLRIYDAVRSSWTSIRRCFLTSDRTHTGMISVQDFRKVLRHFRVSLSEEEFFHVSSYFDSDTTGKICYNSFLWAFLH